MASVANIELLAGHPALDFLNTVDDRLSPRPDDYLGDGRDLTAWGVASGLLENPTPPGEAEFAAAIALREHLTALLDARAAGRPPAAADREALAREVADAYAAGSLSRTQWATCAGAGTPRTRQPFATAWRPQPWSFWGARRPAGSAAATARSAAGSSSTRPSAATAAGAR